MSIFEHADKIADVAAHLASGDLRVAKLFHSDVSDEYGEGTGSVVNVRIPGSTQANRIAPNDKTTALVLGEIEEALHPVELSDHIYSLTSLSEAEISLDIKDFTAQVLRPQARAVVSRAERSAVAALQSTEEDLTIGYDAADPAALFVAFRRKLRENKVPDDMPIYSVVGTSVYADLLNADAIENGRVRGVEVHESNRLLPTEAVAFVKPAFTLVTRAPKVPNGAIAGSSIAVENFSLRSIFTFNGSTASDQSMVSTFLGCAATPLAVEDDVAGTVELVPGAGAVRVDTATAPA